MRILVLSQFFDPEPTPKGLNFVKGLAEAGHSVTVLTGIPNYPGGKVYPGYKVKLWAKENMDGQTIYRVPLYPSHDHSKLGRILNYVSFCISAFFGLLYLSRKTDVIYVYHPPLTVGVAAAAASFCTRKPFVYDIQDLWPDTLGATGMISHPQILRVIGGVCNWVYRRTSRIVVLSPGFKKILMERGVPEQKVKVIYNWCNEKLLQSSFRENVSDLSKAGQFNVVFAGNMGKAQALDTVLQAAQIVQERGASKIKFTLIGGGLEVSRLRASAKALSLKNVSFLDYMPMTKVGSYLKAADVLLVHLKSDPLFEITIPSKTQTYMYVGRPLIMGVKGNAAELVQASGCGLIVPPEDGKSLAEAVLKLSGLDNEELESMGRKGKEFYEKNLSLRVGVQKFISIFKEAL